MPTTLPLPPPRGFSDLPTALYDRKDMPLKVLRNVSDQS